MATYVCISDEGGKNPTCPDMAYHRPSQHLIRSEERLTNEDARDLLRKHQETHRGVKLVGMWEEEEVVDYTDIKARGNDGHNQI